MHASTGGDGGASSSPPLSARRDPPRKRNRAALSCVACRERKIKCNRQVPCDQCIRRGDSELCFLDPYKRGPPASQSKSVVVQAQLAAQAEQIARREQQRMQCKQPATSLTPQHRHQLQPPSSRRSYQSISSAGLAHESHVADQDSSSKGASSSANRAVATPSDAEIGAIKSRLAQLEAMFSASSRGYTDGISPPVYSANEQTGSPRSPLFSVRSLANNSGITGHSTSCAAWRPENSPSTPSAESPQSGRGSLSVYPSANQFAPNNSHSNRDVYPASSDSARKHRPSLSSLAFRTAHDSDTEDAAMVLEGLAMSGQGKGIKSLCPNVSEDPVKTDPKESLASYAARNRERDIMLDLSQGGTSGPSAADVDVCARSKKTAQRCGAPSKTLEEIEEMERQGIDVSPAVKVCALLQTSTSLFRPIYGPESFLGFGMGWAFPAAEAAKDLHVKGGECPGSAQREAVFRAIIRTLPRKQLADQLVDVYADRVNFLAGNIIHMPSFRKELEAFYTLVTVERQARVINNVDSGWLAVFLLVIGLALRFYPCTPPAQWESVSHLFDGRSIHLYASAARTCLVLSRYQSSQSLSVLQSILLSNLSDSHAGRKVDNAMLRIAISNAQSMGLHRLGDKSNQPRASESTGVAVRREVAKRIWYQLVFKDWSCAVSTGVYAINDRQFNTPLPGNYNDDDLDRVPLPLPRPASEHTDMSYSLQVFEVVKAAKLHADLVNEHWLNRNTVAADDEQVVAHDTVQGRYHGFLRGVKLSCKDVGRLDAAYRVLLDRLPPFFAIGEEDGGDSNLEIQRWLVHQMIFHNLLKLHRPALSSKPEARTSCVALARSILYTQKKLRSRCTVIDRLLFNLAQSYTAAIVLLLDLLQHGQDQPPRMRLTIRSEIAEALRALHHVNESNNSTAGGIRVIEALLQEEEVRYKAATESQMALSSQSNGKSKFEEEPAKKKDLLSLALRIARAAKVETDCKSQREQVERDRLAGVPAHDTERLMKVMQEDVEMAGTDSQSSSFAQDGPQSVANTGSGASQCRQEMTKDALSRSLMEQLFFPSQNGGTAAGGSFDHLTDSTKLSTLSFASDTGPLGFDPALNASLFSGAAGTMPARQDGFLETGMVGPNGVEANFSSPLDANISGFDLGAFLAKYDGYSPAGSFSSHKGSGGKGGSAYSSDESAMSNGTGSMGTSVASEHRATEGAEKPPSSFKGAAVDAGEDAQSSPSDTLGAQHSSSHPPTDHTSASIDAFYNWILSQGVNSRRDTPTLSQGQAQASADFRQQPMSQMSYIMSSTGSGPLDPVQASKEFLTSWQPPLGGPPQNGWPSGPAIASGNGAGGGGSTAQIGQQTLSLPTGLMPLPSGSYNLGSPSASADLPNGVEAGFSTGLSETNPTVAAGWLSTPHLFDVGS